MEQDINRHPEVALRHDSNTNSLHLEEPTSVPVAEVDSANDEFSMPDSLRQRVMMELDTRFGLSGVIVGDYVILEQIGAGGMGVVFKVRHSVTRELRALKQLRPELANDPVSRERFLREAWLLKDATSRCPSEYFVKLLSVGSFDGLPYLVMEYVEGSPLTRGLIREMASSESGLLNLIVDAMTKAARGLEALHNAGIVHRDIKPANLLMTNAGEVKIVDFGIAKDLSEDRSREQSKQTATGQTPRTEAYSAPEVLMGHQPDQKADLFSLGAVFYELLTGSRFVESDHQPLSATNPTVPVEISSLVESMLEFSRPRRIASASDVVKRLSAISNESSDVIRNCVTSRFLSRRIVIALAALSLFMATLVYGIITIVTPEGKLIIESEVDDVDVVVSQQGHKVKVIDQQTGSQVSLSSGDYTLALKDNRNDVQLSKNHVTLKRGDREIVRITRVPNSVQGAAADKPVVLDRREAAKRLLEMGSVLDGFIGETHTQITALPEDEFRVVGVIGNDAIIYRDEHAELFAQFPELEVINEADGLELSANGVRRLAKLTKLRRVWVRSMRLDDEAVKELKLLPGLTAIVLDTTKLSATGIAAIGQLTELRELRLIGANFNDDALQSLKPLRKLELLELEATAVLGSGLQHLSPATPLRILTLDWQKAGNDGLAALVRFNFVEQILAGGARSISDEGLIHLRAMPRLRHLALNGTSITDQGLKNLGSLPALEHIDLNDTIVSDAGTQTLASFPKLKHLRIEHTQVGDASLVSLKNLPLISLDVASTAITGKGLSVLNEFKQLEILRIGGDKNLTGDELSVLKMIPHLRVLDVIGWSYELDSWKTIGTLENLESLLLNDSNFNDEGLAQLTGLKKLVHLEIHRTNVTDQGLMQLKKLPKLRDVGCDSSKVTPAGLKALRDSLGQSN